MRIVCPYCSTAYDVPDGLLNGRKAVRCARCAQEWQPAASAFAPPTQKHGLAPPEIAAPPRPVIVENRPAERWTMAGGALAIDRLMAPPAPPPTSLALRLAWLGSIILVLLLLCAGYVWRADVMAAWPPSARLYAALGLAGPAH